jgi:hypothetical protein
MYKTPQRILVSGEPVCPGAPVKPKRKGRLTEDEIETLWKVLQINDKDELIIQHK